MNENVYNFRKTVNQLNKDSSIHALIDNITKETALTATTLTSSATITCARMVKQ